jgi:hypothetical protein
MIEPRNLLPTTALLADATGPAEAASVTSRSDTPHLGGGGFAPNQDEAGACLGRFETTKDFD